MTVVDVAYSIRRLPGGGRGRRRRIALGVKMWSGSQRHIFMRIMGCARDWNDLYSWMEDVEMADFRRRLLLA